MPAILIGYSAINLRREAEIEFMEIPLRVFGRVSLIVNALKILGRLSSNDDGLDPRFGAEVHVSPTLRLKRLARSVP
jgi:hypothetical protein